jgi:uncharacterized protein (DUF433 family)
MRRCLPETAGGVCCQGSLALVDRMNHILVMEPHIVINPDVCNGRPVIQGTRITAQTVLDFLAAGDSVEDVLEEYPSLTREDVQACIRYEQDDDWAAFENRAAAASC